jgi:hypothetical protein
MQYREIIAVCSAIRIKHINTLCGQNVEYLYGKPGGTHSDHKAAKALSPPDCSKPELASGAVNITHNVQKPLHWESTCRNNFPPTWDETNRKHTDTHSRPKWLPNLRSLDSSDPSQRVTHHEAILLADCLSSHGISSFQISVYTQSSPGPHRGFTTRQITAVSQVYYYYYYYY